MAHNSVLIPLAVSTDSSLADINLSIRTSPAKVHALEMRRVASIDLALRSNSISY